MVDALHVLNSPVPLRQRRKMRYRRMFCHKLGSKRRFGFLGAKEASGRKLPGFPAKPWKPSQNWGFARWPACRSFSKGFGPELLGKNCAWERRAKNPQNATHTL